mmetsp:Transcript_24296/g.63755  ORF Transcript_24296/g.63755 Transcript_24296/m.63755 type:complete len:287 (+) Transcript_24296:1070-1930(+)
MAAHLHLELLPLPNHFLGPRLVLHHLRSQTLSLTAVIAVLGLHGLLLSAELLQLALEHATFPQRLRVTVLFGKQGRVQTLSIRPQSRNFALDEPVSVLNAVTLYAQLVMLHLQRLQLLAHLAVGIVLRGIPDHMSLVLGLLEVLLQLLILDAQQLKFPLCLDQRRLGQTMLVTHLSAVRQLLIQRPLKAQDLIVQAGLFVQRYLVNTQVPVLGGFQLLDLRTESICLLFKNPSLATPVFSLPVITTVAPFPFELKTVSLDNETFLLRLQVVVAALQVLRTDLVRVP